MRLFYDNRGLHTSFQIKYKSKQYFENAFSDDDGKSATVRVSQTGVDSRVRREGDETRRLLAAGYIGTSAEQKIIRAAHSPPASTQLADNVMPTNYAQQQQQQQQQQRQPPQQQPQQQQQSFAWQGQQQQSQQSFVSHGQQHRQPIQQAAPASRPSAWGNATRPAAPPGFSQQQTAWNHSAPISRPPPGFQAMSTTNQDAFPPLLSNSVRP